MNNNIDKLWNKLRENNPDKNDLYEISEFVSSIISKIIIERNKRGLSQRDLAKMTGLKQSAIARLESLQSIPRLDTFAKLCKHLNLDFNLVSKSQKPEYSIIYKYIYFGQTQKDNYELPNDQNTTYIQENENMRYSTCIS